ncbi:polyprenyl synthetase family protein [Streptomyces sp. MST-110588]|uniref:polyprenyl synthetase family protein n=1 Tax=Streptomyces sp. MST-110588 TaxID=2833628 RepID=UPI001F5C63E1|nr:polyprenyl synthetase family protein [Streptomyces sp. MST-110588]UNO41958.1 polyprenyl synthetase family protein [Streptomyces sp. MST-110588]
MTTAALETPLDLPLLRKRIDSCLDHYLTVKAYAARTENLPALPLEVLRDFLFAGGKRIRPLMCVLGWYAARGRGEADPVLRAAASLELFHAFALIHDDIMDRSDTRRGHPTVHRTLAERHQHRTHHIEFGEHAAILLGDLALACSQEMLNGAGLSTAQLTVALPTLDAMRTAVLYGQYMDLDTAEQLTDDVERALAVVRYKTAKYTVQHPLHLGAALAGSGPAVRAALSAYALPLGEAFQLRDDLLGVFGDPAVTGKSVLDDLREGKRTVLLALALRHADARQARTLRHLVGDPDLDEEQAATLRTVLAGTGARARVETLIDSHLHTALRALDCAPFPADARDALREVAHTLTERAL